MELSRNKEVELVGVWLKRLNSEVNYVQIVKGNSVIQILNKILDTTKKEGILRIYHINYGNQQLILYKDIRIINRLELKT